MATIAIKIEEEKPVELTQESFLEETELFSLEEASREYKAGRKVLLKESYQDNKGRTWPKGTTGNVVNMKKLKSGFALVVQVNPEKSRLSNQMQSTRSMVIQSANLYNDIFERLSPDHKPLEK